MADLGASPVERLRTKTSPTASTTATAGSGHCHGPAGDRAHNGRLPGRINAVRMAEVRARATGILLKRFFEEGADVKAEKRSSKLIQPRSKPAE